MPRPGLKGSECHTRRWGCWLSSQNREFFTTKLLQTIVGYGDIFVSIRLTTVSSEWAILLSSSPASWERWKRLWFLISTIAFSTKILQTIVGYEASLSQLDLPPYPQNGQLCCPLHLLHGKVKNIMISYLNTCFWKLFLVNMFLAHMFVHAVTRA